MASSTGDLDDLAASITLMLLNGDSVPITLHKFDQMSKVYVEACSKTGAPEHLVRVWLNDKMLKKTQSANDLGLSDGMLLETVVITEATLDLTVKITGPGVDKTVKVETQNTSTVLELMALLTPHGCTDGYKLYHGTKPLATNTDVLYDLKIQNTSTLSAKFGVPDFAAEGKSVEIVFSFDTTSSMANILRQVRKSLKDLVNRLLKDIKDIRIGIIAHGNYCSEAEYYVVKTHELSSDAESLSKFAMAAGKTRGDGAAAYELVLRTATQFSWLEETAKALVVIGDVRPNCPSLTDENIYWHTELDILCGLGVKVYGVQALDKPQYTPFYKELADRTNGAYIKFSDFSLIKEMFLAVCYNEAGEKHMAKYTGQVEAEGKMTEEKKKMFDQLKEMRVSVQDGKAALTTALSIAFDPKKSRNYVAQPWFNKALDKGVPRYTLDPSTGKWMPK